MNDNETKIQETTRELKAYMAKGGGVNQAKIAKALGTSATVISQYLAGKYIGNVDKLTAQIDEFLAREEERTQHAEKSSPFVRTSQANDALSVLTFCHVHRQIGVIHAPAGLGKTVTLRHYARENSWVRIITCVAGMSRRDVLDEIVDALDLRLVRGASGKILKAILEALEGSEIILVFDEAQHLTLKHFETIRHIYDRLGTPVVFAGTNDIIDRMTGRKNVVYDQVFSRVGMKRQLKPAISKTDVAALAESAGVKPGRRDLCDYLYNIAKSAGYYRRMMGCLYTAKVIAKQKLEGLEVAHLQTAEKLLWDGAQ